MAAPIHIADDVAALLGAEVVAQLRTRRAPQARCHVCNNPLADRPATVVVRLHPGPGGTPVAHVVLADPACQPSTIVPATAPRAEPGTDDDVDIVAGTRTRRPHAVLVVDALVGVTGITSVGPVDLRVSALLRSGWTLLRTPDLDHVDVPVAGGWTATRRGPHLHVAHRDGLVLFDGHCGPAPAWDHHLATDGHLLAVFGTRIGLAASDPTTAIDRAAATGDLVAATITATIAPDRTRPGPATRH
jgi:hypothetical protein